MLVITVRQPWASLLVWGIKDIENRYKMPLEASLNQRIYIHSAYRSHQFLPTGYILGYATLVDIVTKSKSVWFRGPYGLVFENAKALDIPIKAKGNTGIWHLHT